VKGMAIGCRLGGHGCCYHVRDDAHLCALLCNSLLVCCLSLSACLLSVCRICVGEYVCVMCATFLFEFPLSSKIIPALNVPLYTYCTTVGLRRALHGARYHT